MAKPKQYEGSSLDGLLKEMGDYEEITARALTPPRLQAMPRPARRRAH